ncbi:hypothetical protein [Actinoalloteichus hymeniacidonis]|uniref:Uncharacterized protein n=1 Tax=Actinoalloteichus hymeniacidonis TaxID=340345 RepID=A0AAC9HMT1_9PSEU|nr:hypothetical protein [Actinoalloteichus hymeniacidonis]AOS62209.1 hypothetical protein TL08_06940 [Actinoalloteichus hymeniacidonis]MBB5909766.1 MFS family permease [Actinoalloteichus hymeniacidonis]
MSGALLRTQWRRVGLSVAVGPLIAGALVAVVGWMASSAWPPSQAMSLVSWLAQAFVLCAGVCVAVALTGDPLIELHESTTTSFRTVQLLRAMLCTVSGLVGAVIMVAPLHLLGVWPRDTGWASVLSPAGAVVFVAVIALFTAAFAGTPSSTTIAVVMAWMCLAMLWDPYVLPLHRQRGLPLLAAAGLFGLAWSRLGDGERNIAKVTTV